MESLATKLNQSIKNLSTQYQLRVNYSLVLSASYIGPATRVDGSFSQAQPIFVGTLYVKSVPSLYPNNHFSGLADRYISLFES